MGDKVEEEGRKPNKYIEAVDKADSEVWEKADAISKNFTADEEAGKESTEAFKEALKNAVTGLLKECNVKEDTKLMNQVITGVVENDYPERDEEYVSVADAGLRLVVELEAEMKKEPVQQQKRLHMLWNELRKVAEAAEARAGHELADEEGVGFFHVKMDAKDADTLQKEKRVLLLFRFYYSVGRK